MEILLVVKITGLNVVMVPLNIMVRQLVNVVVNANDNSNSSEYSNSNCNDNFSNIQV